MMRILDRHLGRFLAGSALLHVALLLAIAAHKSRDMSYGEVLAVQLLPSSIAPPTANESGESSQEIGSRSAGKMVLFGRDVARLATGTGQVDNNSLAESSSQNSLAADADTRDVRIARPETESAGQRLRQAMLQALLPYFEYPLLARRQGWQGAVQVIVHVAHDGSLGEPRVASSSGHPVLDTAALASMRKIHQLPAAATKQLDSRGFDLRVPVVYRLVEG